MVNYYFLLRGNNILNIITSNLILNLRYKIGQGCLIKLIDTLKRLLTISCNFKAEHFRHKLESSFLNRRDPNHLLRI